MLTLTYKDNDVYTTLHYAILVSKLYKDTTHQDICIHFTYYLLHHCHGHYDILNYNNITARQMRDSLQSVTRDGPFKQRQHIYSFLNEYWISYGRYGSSNHERSRLFEIRNLTKLSNTENETQA
jgi:hypothetical protein